MMQPGVQKFYRIRKYLHTKIYISIQTGFISLKKIGI